MKKRVAMFIKSIGFILLVFNVLTLMASCKSKELRGGCFLSSTSSGPSPSTVTGYYAEANVFDWDNVKIDFLYGILFYDNSGYTVENASYDIKILSYETLHGNNVAKEFFIKNVQEDLFTEKYLYDKYHDGHVEEISIPKEAFVNDVGRISINVFVKRMIFNKDCYCNDECLGHDEERWLTEHIYYKVRNNKVVLSEDLFCEEKVKRYFGINI